MPRLTRNVPSYRRHKRSGQAVVTLDGQDFYLGPYGTAVSRSEYDRLVGEWQANGRSLSPAEGGRRNLTINELFVRYWRHATAHYRKPDGSPTSELNYIKSAVRYLTAQHGSTPARQFGPLLLKAVRDCMVETGLTRTGVNARIRRIRQMFKWGVENELVAPSVYQALAAVSGLRAGCSNARESEPVHPVPDEHVGPVRPYVSRQVWAMIELQRLTGMRSGEVTVMRGGDLDLTGRLWLYRLPGHKTTHHGHERVVDLGPKAQAVIREFLKPDLDAYLFSPWDAEAERRAAMRASRKTPLKYGNRPGTNRKRKPRRQPGLHYTKDSYGAAIRRACKKAGIPQWHPNQLRHPDAQGVRAGGRPCAARAPLRHGEPALR